MNKVLIIDIPCPNDFIRVMEGLGLVTVSGAIMTEEIINRVSFWNKFNPASTLLVFPGNGASIVRDYVSKDWLTQWQWMTVHAKRYWRPGEEPWVEANRVFVSKMVLGLKDVVIIDDVTSSGKTANLLQERNSMWIPGAKWHLAVWIAQKAAKLKGFSTFVATVEAGEKNRKVPINSLSTLVDDKDIADCYILRNFLSDQQAIFSRILDDLRNSSSL
jgi:hypoxanthine phosphoribosyltransferase